MKINLTAEQVDMVRRSVEVHMREAKEHVHTEYIEGLAHSLLKRLDALETSELELTLEQMELVGKSIEFHIAEAESAGVFNGLFASSMRYLLEHCSSAGVAVSV